MSRDLDLIISRATTSNDLPLDGRYVWELASALSFPLASSAFPISFTRRLGRTRSWRTALKCLLLLHRLVRTTPANHPFHALLLSARANSLISLRPNATSSHHCNLFLHSYAHLLNDLLTSIPTSGPSEPESALQQLPQLQCLLDRAMHCQPGGPATQSFIVRDAMKQVVRDSFVCYSAVQRGLNVVLDALLDMPYSGCVAGLEAYRRAAHQADTLSEFYDWARSVGLCGAYEYPVVEKIPRIQVRALRSLLEATWCLTGSNSSASSPRASSSSSSVATREETVVSNAAWEKFEEESDVDDDEEKPLLKFSEGDAESSWEVVLEASVGWFPSPRYLKDEQMLYKINNGNPFNLDFIQERSGSWK